MVNFAKSWNSYKKRLLPWILAKYKQNTGNVSLITNSVDDQSVLKQLESLFCALHNAKKCGNADIEQVMESSMGFKLSRQRSNIVDAGLGVFVSSGCITKGNIAAIYPGTVYTPSNAIFFQSIRNSFVFRCKDHIYIDGKDSGLSKYTYKSCAGRDRVGPYELCDITWLTNKLKCPLNVGQYINNQNQEYKANVHYQEFDFPRDFPIHLREFIPNISVNGLECHTSSRTVVLIATRDILKQEELLSTYLTVTS
uniref:SET domain-containing protein 9-like n=1 Tax=Phallusia mammillata TaxID=59560 RepID=A0A6F9DRC0_9ASCI|nr:SET domain-containing protein 9-like [Phallusia mammillata]